MGTSELGSAGQDGHPKAPLGTVRCPVDKDRLSPVSVIAVTATKEHSENKWDRLPVSNGAPCVPITNDWTREDAQYLVTDAWANGSIAWMGLYVLPRRARRRRHVARLAGRATVRA